MPIQNNINEISNINENSAINTNSTLSALSSTTNSALLTFNKSSSPPYVKTGDIITYTLSMENIGNLVAKDIVATDEIPANTTFISNSFSGDGVNLGISNELIIYIDNLSPGAAATVTFDTLLTSMPSTGEVHNSAMVGYMYTLDSLAQDETANTISNIATTTVNEAIIDNSVNGAFHLSISPDFGDVGDILTYTLSINNAGNVEARNIILTSTIPDSLAFVSDSVYVDSIQQPGVTPLPGSGINIGTLNVGGTSTVVFNVEVATIPSINLVSNIIMATFNYTLDPSVPNDIIGYGYSNNSIVEINKAIIDYDNGNGIFNLKAKKYASIGDKITYNYTLSNTGNVPANNIVFTSIISKELTFEENSVFINGNLVAGENPNLGISLGSISPNDVLTLLFNATLNTIPSNNNITNNATVNYVYTKNPQIPNNASGIGTSEVFVTEVNLAIIEDKDFIVKCDKEYGSIGDTLTYELSIKNIGNIAATNVFLVNNIQQESSYISNSLYINAVNVNEDNLATINLGTIPSGETFTVNFKTLVNTLPSSGLISTNSNLTYNYTFDPSLPNSGLGESSSNIAQTKINSAIIDNSSGFNLYASEYNKVGDTITYTFSIKNTGNTAATDVILFDTIPLETSFIENSININGVNVQNNNSISSTGIYLGTINFNTLITVDFKVIVNSIPSINPIKNSGFISYKYIVDPIQLTTNMGSGVSNIATTTINQGKIQLKGYVDKSYSNTTETLTYSYVLENIGNTNINNILFISTIPNEAQYLQNTLALNGVSIPDLTTSLSEGISLGSLNEVEIATLNFSVKATSIPSTSFLKNSGLVLYDFIVSPQGNGVVAEDYALSNEVETIINEAIIDYKKAGFDKFTSSEYLGFGDVLTYTNNLKNTGNVVASNVIFTDTLSNGTSFISNSVQVNGVIELGANPSFGINLGDILPNSIVNIQYAVMIETIPSLNLVSSSSTVTFNYKTDTSSSYIYEGFGLSNSPEVTIKKAIIDYDRGNGEFITSYYDRYTNIGKEITFEFTLGNTGNTQADKVILSNTLIDGVSFIPNSVYINSVNIPGATPENGINIGTIPPLLTTGVKSKIKFSAIVNTIPSLNEFTNKATVTYAYNQGLDSSTEKIASGSSDEVTIKFYTVILDNNKGGIFTQTVNKSYAKKGDILTYTIDMKNTGNVSANNVIFINTIPDGTTFIENSLKLNGITLPGENPNPPYGINIGTLAADILNTLVFEVLVYTIPSSEKIQNSSTLVYNYIYDPSVPEPLISSTWSNIAETFVRCPIINKSDLFTLDVPSIAGDEISYNFIMQNTGNIAANNTIFKGILSQELNFINNTLKVNNILVPNENPLDNNGVNLGTLNPLDIITVNFNVKVNNIPSINPISSYGRVDYNFTANPSIPNGESSFGESEIKETDIKLAIINNENDSGLIKNVSKSYAKRGDTLIYTISLKNTGNVTAKEVFLRDSIPYNTKLIDNSIFINDISSVNEATLPNLQLSLGNIDAGAIFSVIFSVTLDTIINSSPILNSLYLKFDYLDNNTTLTDIKKSNVVETQSANTIIDNTAYVDFNYDIDTSTNLIGSGQSNIVKTYFREAIIDNTSIHGFKSNVDKNKAKLGDTLTYTIILENSGNITANNIIFMDSISKEVSFLENSLKINGVTLTSGYNPIYPNEINIGNINSNEILTINYSVTVDTLPSLGVIESNSSIKYSYILDPTSQNETLVSSYGNKLITKVNEAIIDNRNGKGKFNTTFYNEYTTLGKEINYKIILANTGNTIARNVIFVNTLPYGVEYSFNSLKVNGESIFNGTPYGGINLGVMEPLSLGENNNLIEFKAKVISIPNINPISNKAHVTFTYNEDNDFLEEVIGNGESDMANTEFNVAYINGENFNMYCDKAYADTGDTLNYVLTMKNIGNVDATEAILVTTIPKEVSFINDSLYLNNINKNIVNSSNVITLDLGTIPKEEVFTINFKTMVNTIPSSNFINCNAWITFNYQFNPVSKESEKGEGLSNLAETKINKAIIDKSGVFTLSSSNYNKLKDIVTYNFNLSNTGNSPAINVIFKDTIPKETSFVENSTFINGVTIANGNPTSINGLYLGTIKCGDLVNVKFDVIVDTIPNVNSIENFATVDFSYLVDEVNEISKFSYGISNTSFTTINQGLIILNNIVDRKYASTNDTLTYEVVMQNKGNVAINNVIFTDSIPVESTFIEDSMYVNLSTIPLQNPSLENGISLGTMEVSDVVTVNFKVLVNTLPNINPIKNIANASFDFILSPDNGGVIVNEFSSQISETIINEAIIDNFRGHGFIKYTNKTFVGFGDEVTYTHVIKNTGNITAEDVLFYDSIPNGSSFIENSLLLNGVTMPNENPENGINIGNIQPNIENILIYKVQVNALSTFILMESKANVTFKYTVDPSIPKGYSGFGESNILKINLIKAIIDYDNGNGGFVGPSGEIITNIGKYLDISYSIKNTGNVTASNIIFNSTIPNGLKFVENSLKINGQLQNNLNPQNGLSLGQLEPFSTKETEILIDYKLCAVSIPNINPVKNIANVTFNYTQVESNINGAIGNGSSNECTINVIGAIIDNNNNSFIQSVSKNYAEINDFLTYNMIITNTGNVAANNVIFKDTLPYGLTINPTLLIINGFASQVSRENFINGIPLGNILPGDTNTLMFSVVITPDFINNPISNEGTVTFDYISDPTNIKVESSYGISNKVSTKLVYTPKNPEDFLQIVDKTYVFIGETLTYNTTITNSGNTSLDNVLVTTPIPSGASFIRKSLVVNNITLPLLAPDIPNGINIGTINEGDVKTISFKVTVNTVPSTNWLNTKSFINYTYRIDPSIPNNKTKNTTSNETSVRVIDSIIDNEKAGNFRIITSQDAVIIGDVITYLIELRYNGNLNLTNVFLKDTIPNGTEFVPDSLYLNGVNITSENIYEGNGLRLGEITSDSITTLTFNVLVNTLPSNYKILNNATIKYNLTIDTIPAITITTGGNSNETSTLFKKAIINNKEGFFTITPDKYFATLDDEIIYTINLKNTGTTDANNIVLTSTIPVGTEFIKDSLVVNGRKILTGNPSPPHGVNIGSLLFGGTTTVMYKVKVTNSVFIDNITEISNSANVSFNYTIDRLYPNNTKGYGSSNSVTTKTIYSVITGDTFTNVADKSYCILGDIINYSLNLTNSGNADISNIILTNTLPEGLTFVEDSLYVNGKIQEGSNILEGIILQNLDKGASISANFNAMVTGVPIVNATKNIATVTYDYEVDPINKRIFTKTSLSKVCVVTINQAIIDYNNNSGFILDTKEGYVSEGDKITYVVSLKNTGNVEANMVTLVNKIPEGTTYVDNSVFINGVYLNNNNPYIINLGNIFPGASSTIIFKVNVITTPSPNTIANSSFVSFKYTSDPTLPLENTSNGNSNENIVVVNTAGFNIEKEGFTLSSDKNFATINDVINYKAILRNIGNTTVVNALFINTLPYGIEFVEKSVSINGISDTIANPSLGNGILIKNISANEVLSISYKGLIMTLPKENPVSNNALIKYSYILSPLDVNRREGQDISNTVFTSISSPFISNADGGFIITTDKKYLKIGDTLTYTVTIKNTGNINADEVIYFDTIPGVTSLVPNSIYINEIQTDGNLTEGINIGYLGSNAISILTFSIMLNSYPKGNELENSGYILYRYLLPVYESNSLINQDNNLITPFGNTINYLADTLPSNILYSNSNIISVLIINPKLEIKISSDKSIIDVGDTLTYTISITNIGNILAENILITNTIPNTTSYIDKSLTINGVARTDIDLSSPLDIGNLDIQDSMYFAFKVISNSIPHSNILDYLVSASFNYKSTEEERLESAEATSNYNGVSINSANLNIIHGADKLYVTDGDIVNYNITIKNNGNIDALNICVIANLQKEAKYIQESLRVNFNESVSSILNGLTIDSISPGAEVSINYQVKILDNTTFKDISSYIDISYSYENSDINVVTVNKESNKVFLNYRQAEIVLSKYQDKKLVVLKEVICYSLKVKNIGNIPANNILIKDNLHPCFEFIQGSLCINSIKHSTFNITDGIIIKKLDSYSEITITFMAEATKVPFSNIAYNVVSAKYMYKITDNHPEVPRYVEDGNNDIIVIAPICSTKKIMNCENKNSNNNNSLKNNYYSIKGLPDKEDYISAGEFIRDRYMWSKNEINTQINLGSSIIRKIESINGEVELVRTEIIESPFTGENTNLDNKKLTGKKMIINAMIKYSIRYIDNNGEIKNQKAHKLFGLYIAINPKYALENLKVDYCLEDITIVKLCDNIAHISSRVLFYLLPENYKKILNSTYNTSVIGISNSKLCNNVKGFITPNDIYWEDFNIYVKDNLGINFHQIVSAKAKVKILYHEVITQSNYEKSNKSIKKLLVNMSIEISVGYIEKSKYNVVQNLKGEIPFSTTITIDNNVKYDDLFKISACIENIYVGMDNQSLFTNTTVVIKANKINQ